MSLGEMAILALIILGFASFAAVLAWASSKTAPSAGPKEVQARHHGVSAAVRGEYALYD